MKHDPIKRVILRVAWRIRAQRATAAAVGALVPSLLALTVLVYLVKAQLLASAPLLLLCGMALALPLLAASIAGIGRIAPQEAAKRIDRSHDLKDRIGIAHEFQQVASPSPWLRAQIADAIRHLPRVVPSRAAPFRWPKDSRTAALLLVALGVVLVLRFPVIPRSANAPPPLPKLVIDPTDLAEQRALVEQLRQQGERGEDPAVEELAAALTKLFDQLERKTLTRKQVFAKLAELENRYFDGLEGNFDDLLKRLKKIGGPLQREKLTRDLGEALRRAAPRKARKEVERLARELEQLKTRQRQRIARALRKAARQASAQSPLIVRAQQLDRQIRRLQRKLKQQPNNAAARRRLQRQRRQLQRLNRQAQKRAQQRRQLQRLNRSMERAAASLLDKLSADERRALQQLAEQLGRFADQLDKLRTMSKAQLNLRDLKEMLRRLGKQGSKARLARLKDFMRRAGGKGKGKGNGKGKGKGKGALVLGRGGQSLPLPGPAGQGAGRDQGGAQGGQPADGVGDGVDPNLLDRPTRLAGAKRKGSFAEGQQGPGPTRSEVILGAADEGFATRNYRRVYRDYQQVIEDVLQREDVPLGYKYYVKRYFDLIKPR
jgi:hypothetical protein